MRNKSLMAVAVLVCIGLNSIFLPRTAYASELHISNEQTELTLNSSTYFDKLSKLFDSADQPIRLDDIEQPGWPNARVCVETEEAMKAANRLSFVSLTRHSRIEGPYGSLLPAEEFVKILFSPNLGHRDIFSKNGEFDQVVTTGTYREITTVYYNNERNIEQTITIHKLNDTLLYRRIAGPDRKSPKFMGYCYRVTN